jgi:Lhr-like helicase
MADLMARYAVPEIYDAIRKAGTSIVFVNTRAQAELMLQMLWDANDENLPIAVYHGSLSRERRRRTEAMMAAGKIRSVVATAALELGIDWGDVDLVIQVAAPKGVSRLLQRVGRSNHRLDIPSRALLVPANRFEALECRAALTAIEQGQLDGEAPGPGSLDVLVQHILSCACSARPAVGGEPKVPAYSGGQMPLSTFLADGVRSLLATPEWGALPEDVRHWLDLQARFSTIPSSDRLLVEHFLAQRFYRTLFYTFMGRRANQMLGMLITRRMEHLGLKPLSFQITDYGLVVSGLSPVSREHIAQFLAPDILGDELEEWILDSPMLKRSFRHVATVTGIVEQQKQRSPQDHAPDDDFHRSHLRRAAPLRTGSYPSTSGPA